MTFEPYQTASPLFTCRSLQYYIRYRGIYKKKLMKPDNLDEAMYANLKAEFNDYKKYYVAVLMKLSDCITRGLLNCTEMILNRRGL